MLFISALCLWGIITSFVAWTFVSCWATLVEESWWCWWFSEVWLTPNISWVSLERWPRTGSVRQYFEWVASLLVMLFSHPLPSGSSCHAPGLNLCYCWWTVCWSWRLQTPLPATYSIDLYCLSLLNMQRLWIPWCSVHNQVCCLHNSLGKKQGEIWMFHRAMKGQESKHLIYVHSNQTVLRKHWALLDS